MVERIYWQRVGINLARAGEYNTAATSPVICLCLLIGREIVQVIDLQHKMKKGRAASSCEKVGRVLYGFYRFNFGFQKCLKKLLIEANVEAFLM